MCCATRAAYAQVGREDECYAASFACTACHGRFYGGISRDPGRPDAYPLTFRFCPICGSEFSGPIPQPESYERRCELRTAAFWKNREFAESRAITYEVQTSSGLRPGWNAETWRYPLKIESAREALGAWRQRLAEGSWFGEDVRLIARTPRGDKVVFGPVRLAANTHRAHDGLSNN